MILREIMQDASIDRVLAEYCLVLCETKFPQPNSKVHDGGSTARDDRLGKTACPGHCFRGRLLRDSSTPGSEILSDGASSH
jgi:hypothetical protein